MVSAFTGDELREAVKIAADTWPLCVEVDFFPDSMRLEIMERLKGKVKLPPID